MRKDNSSKYHFLIGGKESENNESLSLEIINYFCIGCTPSKDCIDCTHSEDSIGCTHSEDSIGCTPSEDCIACTPSEKIKDFFEDGMKEDELDEYTKKITEFKKNGKEDGKEGTSSGGFSTSYVLAVSKSEKTKYGNRGILISLEYFNNRKLEKNMKKDVVNTCSLKGP